MNDRIDELKFIKSLIISANAFNRNKLINAKHKDVATWIEGKINFGENIICLVDRRIIELYEGSAKLAKPDQITETDEK